MKNIKKILQYNQILEILQDIGSIKSGVYPLIKIGWDQKKLQNAICIALKGITSNVDSPYKLTILVEEETMLGILPKQKVVYFDKKIMKISERKIN